MVKIVGVRFRNAGKVYYFDPKNYKIKADDHVIVETARGVEYGTVVGGIRSVPNETIVQPLRSVIRMATPDDDARVQRNRKKEREALRICQEKINKHKLEMKLIDAEYTFDNNKVLFYFTADGRIDFRELVKDLAAVFKMRIELRQIGVRDETKILGGIGICGRVLCCNSYLSDFAPVSIKMAKEQNLSLNPTKISGVCGRLMCCLKNEEETYEYLNSRLPAIGDSVTTLDGQKGEVQSVNVLRQRVKVLIDVDDEKELQEFGVEELKFRPKRRKEKGGKGDRSEKNGKGDRAEKNDRGDRPEKNEKGDRSEKNDRGDRSEKNGKSDRAEKNERSDRSEKNEKGDRSEKSDRGDRAEKNGRSSRPEKHDRGGRGDRSEKNGKGGREDTDASVEKELQALEAFEKKEGKSKRNED